MHMPPSEIRVMKYYLNAKLAIDVTAVVTIA